MGGLEKHRGEEGGRRKSDVIPRCDEVKSTFAQDAVC
jgi:hypothetical protein